jgi:hypothetical protein
MSTLGTRIAARGAAERRLPIAILCVSQWGARIETRRRIPEAAVTAALEAGSFLSNEQRDAVLAMLSTPLQRLHKGRYRTLTAYRSKAGAFVFAAAAVRALIPLGFAYEDPRATPVMRLTIVGENYAREIMRERGAL